MIWRVSRAAFVIAAGSATALGLVGVASAGSLSGRLDVPRDWSPAAAPEGGPAQFYWEESNGFFETRARRRDVSRELTVVLLGALESGERPASELELRGGALQPSTFVAQRGTTLRITNTDACSHELYSEGIEGFPPLQTAPGHARTLEIAQPGVFEIADKTYAHVRGHIHVVDDLVARGELDRSGRFRFRGVPDGRYVLKAYHGADEVASQEVTIDGEVALDTVPLSLPGR